MISGDMCAYDVRTESLLDSIRPLLHLLRILARLRNIRLALSLTSLVRIFSKLELERKTDTSANPIDLGSHRSDVSPLLGRCSLVIEEFVLHLAPDRVRERHLPISIVLLGLLARRKALMTGPGELVPMGLRSAWSAGKGRSA